MSGNVPKYDPKEIEQQCLKAIEENRLIFFNELQAYVPCSRATLYNMGIDKLDSIKDALEHSKILVKANMRKRWYISDSAALQLAAYRLASTSEEHRKLNQAYLDHTTKGEAVQTLDLSSLSEEAVEQLYNQLKDDSDPTGK